ncbi:MAG: DUF4976 domain-containing protein [Bacteroidales bacterium]|nr:DUF4976 domain-containing protein [Bacteroidales bacterium]
MMNVFRLLLSLCGLPAKEGLDGHDMTPLLTDALAEWIYPAVSEIQIGNAAVRSQNWRYIRYNDGTEELYDRSNDPNEWYNLAGDPQYKQVIEEHRKWVPASFAETMPSKESYSLTPQVIPICTGKQGCLLMDENDIKCLMI